MSLGPSKNTLPGQCHQEALDSVLALDLFNMGNAIFSRVDSHVRLSGAQYVSYTSKRVYYPHAELQSGRLMSAWVLARRIGGTTLMTQVVRHSLGENHSGVAPSQVRMSVIDKNDGIRLNPEFDQMSEAERTVHIGQIKETLELIRGVEGLNSSNEYV